MPDPLHLTPVFGISHNTAVRDADVTEHLLNDELDHPQSDLPKTRTAGLPSNPP
jgi:hypothetical protein